MDWNTVIHAHLHFARLYLCEETFPLSSQIALLCKHSHSAESFARLMAEDLLKSIPCA